MEKKEETLIERCPICISPILEESYLDQCFHKFCYNCILQWSKVVASKRSTRQSFVHCPLCKTKNSSIIYEYDGISFKKHLIYQNAETSIFFTKAHQYRLRCYYVDPGFCISLLMLFDVSERAWLRGAAPKFCYLYHEYIQINLFSRYRVVVSISISYAYFLLYAYEFFVTGDIPGNINISRYWKSFKYRQPNQWLYSWVSREIQALVQEKDVDIIVHHILGVIDSWRRNEPKGFKMTPESKQEEFKSKIADAAKPFLTGRTDRFVNELEMFIASGLNIEAYDKVYIKHLGWKIPDINNEDDKEQEERNPVIPLLSFSDEDLDETT